MTKPKPRDSLRLSCGLVLGERVGDDESFGDFAELGEFVGEVFFGDFSGEVADVGRCAYDMLLSVDEVDERC